jgi:hypothetical protein
MNIHIENLIRELKTASIDDIEFTAELIPDHRGVGEVKKGFCPVKVRGIVIPEPIPVVYVRAQNSEGMSWYVLDWSVVDSQKLPHNALNRAQERTVASEEEAKQEVLRGLLALWVVQNNA